MIDIPHPRALFVTLVILAAAVGALETGLLTGGGVDATTTPTVNSTVVGQTGAAVDLTDDEGRIHAERLYETPPDRIERKASKHDRAVELQKPTQFLNSEPFSLSDHVGEKVILVEFWTFDCYNCQNTHPHIKDYWRQYRDDGLLVVGVHYPEFEHERKPSNVRDYLDETNTTYPVVLDNKGATWRAYNQRYWPTRYLIGPDGFIRYKKIGEGGYEETDRKIQSLLSELDRVKNDTDGQ